MTDRALAPQLAEDLILGRVGAFARLLRASGFRVGGAEVLAALESLSVLDMSQRNSLYLGLRLAMLRDGAQVERFDELFEEYWHGVSVLKPPRADEDEGEEDVTRDGPGVLEDEPAGDAREVEWSAHEVLGERDFADYTEDDWARMRALLLRLKVAGPWRTSRRREASRVGELDVRRTVRASFRTGGDPVAMRRRQTRLKQRPLTFVCDVSRSMESYAEAVLQLAHTAVTARRRVEAFAFATRLTRLTRAIVLRDPHQAIARATSTVVDWSGGTRIGESLARLNREHPSATRGAVVVIASDGWDLGDPDLLCAEAATLQRIAHSVIWLNPQLKDPRYEPLTRGMAAALPYVDHFVACHNFASFRALLRLLDEL